jgi:hypothetical protein
MNNLFFRYLLRFKLKQLKTLQKEIKVIRETIKGGK